MAAFSSEDRRENLTCAICMDIFDHPKLLPCSHTFCLECLEDLTSSNAQSFSCPICRELTRVPPGGVSAFKNNFYILPEDLERAKNWRLCMTHGKTLELYCTQCNEALCINCKLTKHESHPTQDMVEAADHAMSELCKDRSRLESAVMLMVKRTNEVRTQRKALHDKKATVKTVILNRHATLVAMADKFRDELLGSLDAVTEKMEIDLTKSVSIMEKNLRELRKLYNRVDQALSDEENYAELVTVADEMRRGRGSCESVRNLTSPRISTLRRPVLHFSITDDVVMNTTRNFLGEVLKIKMKMAAPEVKVVKHLCCGQEEDTEVYSILPRKNNAVVVSYTRRGLRADAPCQEFDENGKWIYTYPNLTGKQTLVWCTASGTITSAAVGNKTFDIVDKSQKKTSHRLSSVLLGTAAIQTTKVTSEDPYETKVIQTFRIKVGACRAFDVDASEQLFVVLEEPLPPSTQRRVRLYRRDNEDAIDTYTPPPAFCQPSDVCFYRLGGRQVLLVSDEGNDAIHVVDVQSGALTFLRYLAPGCPLLVQPTALNTDIHGRLWVACRGGTMLILARKWLSSSRHTSYLFVS